MSEQNLQTEPTVTLVEHAKAEALDRLARRGSVAPFALTADGTILSGEGARHSQQLSDLYQRLSQDKAQPVAVASVGSSEQHALLLILFYEDAGNSAFRSIYTVEFTRRPAFIGPILILAGKVTSRLLERAAMTSRIWPATTVTSA
jgi:hypothetical protein